MHISELLNRIEFLKCLFLFLFYIKAVPCSSTPLSVSSMRTIHKVFNETDPRIRTRICILYTGVKGNLSFTLRENRRGRGLKGRCVKTPLSLFNVGRIYDVERDGEMV